jgi:hypothetical protein
MTLAGCGGDFEADQAAKAPASADAAAEAEAEAAAAAGRKAKDTAARTTCASYLAPLLDELTALESRLGIGMNHSDFAGYVGDAAVAYDRIPFGTMRLECTLTAGIKLKKAINEYIKANNAWQECNVDSGCVVEGAVLDGIRAHWTMATTQIDAATAILATNRAYLAAGGNAL